MPSVGVPTVPAIAITPAASPATAIVVTDEQPQYQQLKVADTQVTLYMPESLKNELATQLIVALIDQPGSQSFKDLTGYAEQQHSILIAPAFNYSQMNNQALAGKINSLINQLQLQLHTKFKSQLEFYALNQGVALAQTYALLYPQSTLGIVKQSSGTFVLNQTVIIKVDSTNTSTTVGESH